MGVDIEGTRSIANVAAQVSIERFFYLSHLGADRASAYPVLKSKAIAESAIIQSGIPYTIFRSAALYGPGDQFTTNLARLMRVSPGILLMPANSNTMLQPLWVEDLVTCLTLAMDDPATAQQIYSVGGPEYLSFQQIMYTIKAATNTRRWIIPISPAYLRILSVYFENSFKNFPLSVFWQDYLATDRTCELDTLPRVFGLMPVRFGRQLDYLNQPDPRNKARKGTFSRA
jgi:NADH dehydrogenase